MRYEHPATAKLGDALHAVDKAMRDIAVDAEDMLNREDSLEDLRYLIGLLADVAPDDTQIPLGAMSLVANSIRAYQHHQNSGRRRHDHYVPLVDARPREAQDG